MLNDMTPVGRHVCIPPKKPHGLLGHIGTGYYPIESWRLTCYVVWFSFPLNGIAILTTHFRLRERSPPPGRASTRNARKPRLDHLDPRRSRRLFGPIYRNSTGIAHAKLSSYLTNDSQRIQCSTTTPLADGLDTSCTIWPIVNSIWFAPQNEIKGHPIAPPTPHGPPPRIVPGFFSHSTISVCCRRPLWSAPQSWASRMSWIFRWLPPGRIQNRPKVDHPPQQEKPQNSGQAKLNEGDQEPSLKQLAQPGYNKTTQSCKDVAGRTLTWHRSASSLSRIATALLYSDDIGGLLYVLRPP